MSTTPKECFILESVESNGKRSRMEFFGDVPFFDKAAAVNSPLLRNPGDAHVYLRSFDLPMASPAVGKRF